MGRPQRARRPLTAALLAVALLVTALCLNGCAAGSDGGGGEHPGGRPSTGTDKNNGRTDMPENPDTPEPQRDGQNTGGQQADGQALLRAAEQGDTAAVREALAAGADHTVRDDRGRTPLLLASAADHVATAKALLDAGADPDARDDRQDTAWLVTGVTGSTAMARALLAAEPDLTRTNRFGGTSLIPASERGHVGYVRYVTEHTDMDVNHVNNLGWTALLEAVILGDGGATHQKTVRALLDAGADPGIADNDGVTPLQHAEDRDFTALATLLRDTGR